MDAAVRDSQEMIELTSDDGMSDDSTTTDTSTLLNPHIHTSEEDEGETGNKCNAFINLIKRLFVIKPICYFFYLLGLGLVCADFYFDYVFLDLVIRNGSEEAKFFSKISVSVGALVSWRLIFLYPAMIFLAWKDCPDTLEVEFQCARFGILHAICETIPELVIRFDMLLNNDIPNGFWDFAPVMFSFLSIIWCSGYFFIFRDARSFNGIKQILSGFDLYFHVAVSFLIFSKDFGAFFRALLEPPNTTYHDLYFYLFCHTVCVFVIWGVTVLPLYIWFLTENDIPFVVYLRWCMIAFYGLFAAKESPGIEMHAIGGFIMFVYTTVYVKFFFGKTWVRSLLISFCLLIVVPIGFHYALFIFGSLLLSGILGILILGAIYLPYLFSYGVFLLLRFSYRSLRRFFAESFNT